LLGVYVERLQKTLLVSVCRRWCYSFFGFEMYCCGRSQTWKALRECDSQRTKPTSSSLLPASLPHPTRFNF